MKQRLAVIAALLLYGVLGFSQALEIKWTCPQEFKYPESTLYSARYKSIFVSNMNGDILAKDGNGFISRLTLDGAVEKFVWADGLNAPKGMAIYRGILYVADIDELVLIDIKTASIIKKYLAEGAEFLNDVALCEDGSVFITDSKVNKIYRFKDGKLNVWLNTAELKGINGLWIEKDKLYVGSKKILEIDLKTKMIKSVVEAYTSGGIDGLEKIGKTRFICSNWKGDISMADGNKMTQLLDFSTDINKTGDLDFVPEKNLVVVPTLTGNKVSCYSLK
jgi:hypothetical protein